MSNLIYCVFNRLSFSITLRSCRNDIGLYCKIKRKRADKRAYSNSNAPV